MKLLSIRFKNIHSLKGKHEVRFDVEPLLSAGIFAITGATGAGKSSLLDVITLALYNQVPRFKSKISKSEIQKMGSVVTHFTDEAWAEVSYQVKQRKYLSRWEISKTKSGNFRDYDMSVTDLMTGRQLVSRRSQVPSVNASLIGLNYDQFVKSIVLSQGEFAKFLKSKKGERSKLLEDITGTHIYRSIGAKAYELLKEKKQETEVARERLNMISFLSAEEKSRLQQSVTDKQTELDKLVKSAERVIKHKEIKQIELDYADTKASIEREEKDYQALTESHAQDEQRLKLHLALMPLAPDIKSLHDAQHSYQHETEDIASYQSRLDQYKSEADAAIKEMSLLVGKSLSSDTFTEEMEVFEKLVDGYNNELKQYIAKGKDLRARIAAELPHLEPTLQTKLSHKISPVEAIDLLDTRMASIGESAGISMTQLIAQKNKLQLQVDLTHQWISLLEQEAKLTDEAEKINSESAELNKRSEGTRQQLERFDVELRHKKEEILIKEKESQSAIAHATLEEHRAQLVDREPCPLCGSLEHPYALHDAYQDVGQLSVALAGLKRDRQKLEGMMESAKIQQASTQTRMSTLQKQLEVSDEELRVSQQEKTKRLQEFPELNQVDRDASKDAIKDLEKQMKEVDQRIHHQQELSSVKTIRKDYEQLSQVLTQYQITKKDRDKAYQGDDIHKDANRIQDKYTAAKAGSKEQAALINRSTAQKSSLSKQIEKLTQSLSSSTKNLGFSDVREARQSLLTTQEAGRISTAVERLKAIATTIDTKKEALAAKRSKLENQEIPKTSMEEIDRLLTELNENIQSCNKDIGSLQEKIKQDDTQLKQHQEIKLKLDEQLKDNRKYLLLSQYIGDAQGAKFSNFAQELTLSRLLSIANARLMTMSDRYLLKHDLDDDDLLVIDQYQGNAERVVRTLSGGESFIISLALALSLSDLASKNVSLESLFIDEGFGTLDPETLDMALSTLEKLQNDSGKTIGVISHVEAIKERMLTQIKVKKNMQGYGVIEIVG